MPRRNQSFCTLQKYMVLMASVTGFAGFVAAMCVILLYERDPVLVVAQIGSITTATVTLFLGALPVVRRIEHPEEGADPQRERSDQQRRE